MTESDQTGLLEKCIRSWPCNPGIALSTVQIGLLNLYLDELEKWNHKINLTGLRSRGRIISELLLDSLLPARFFPAQGTILDVGSGAGFPSIPLKIWFSDPVFHLVEPTLKKTNFLKQVIRLAGLKDIEVFRGRIENLDNVLVRDHYAAVISRGLFLDSQILSCCAECLATEGLLFTYQGSSGKSDSRGMVRECEKHGFLLQESISYSVPGIPMERRLVIFIKKL